jgi:hypothetical protein
MGKKKVLLAIIWPYCQVGKLQTDLVMAPRLQWMQWQDHIGGADRRQTEAGSPELLGRSEWIAPEAQKKLVRLVSHMSHREKGTCVLHLSYTYHVYDHLPKIVDRSFVLVVDN